MTSDSPLAKGSPPADPSENTQARKAVAEAVLTTPGVTRLEPSLRQAFQQLASWRRLTSDTSERDWELIELSASESGVSAKVDIGVDFSRTFVDIGLEVRSRVRGALADNGLQVSRVDVAILSAKD